MNLVVFDLDETLVESMDLDGQCFLHAFERGFGLRDIDPCWSHYSHVTDAGISREVLGNAFGAAGLEARVSRHREVFAELIGERLGDGSSSVRPVAGAARLLARLGADPGWSFAVATGGWRATALLKLQAAGLDLGAAPLVTCDDAISREEILEIAIERARARLERSLERVVAVGDAVWDVAAARRIGLAFVGVAAGDRAELLRAAGARGIVADFRDQDGVLRVLATAEVPDRPRRGPAAARREP